MKNPRKYLVIGAVIFTIGIAFQILETIFFLVVNGWHFFPANHTEALCDWVSYCFVLFGGALMQVSLYHTIQKEG